MEANPESNRPTLPQIKGPYEGPLLTELGEVSDLTAFTASVRVP